MRRGNSSQLDLFEWLPPTRADLRASVIAMFATSTASVVAARHGVSRSTILGIAKRSRDGGQSLALIRPASARAQRRAERIAAAEVVPARPPLPPVGVRFATVGTPMPVTRIDVAPLITADLGDVAPLLGLGDRQCRAITDDLGACCGLPTEGRSSWCRAHRATYRASARPLKLETL